MPLPLTQKSRSCPSRGCVTTVAALLLASLCLGCRHADTAARFPAQEEAHRYALESELRESSAEQASFVMAIQSRTRASEEIDGHINADRQALEQLEKATHEYMQENSTAVAAILAGAASTDAFSDKSTSEEAKHISVGVGVIVLLWAATHQEELSAVVQTLGKARDRRVWLEQDLEREETERTVNLGQIEHLQVQQAKAREKVSMLRVALCGSACSEQQ